MKITRQVFVDANIFTYLLTGHPTCGKSCQELLEKVEQGTIEAFISPLVIDEVSYVLMVQTARRTGSPKDARSMKKALLHAWQDCLVPVHEFHDYLDVLISKGHLKALSLDYSISKIALECAREYRLLPRDALRTACCKAFGIKEMATNDADFERVGFLIYGNHESKPIIPFAPDPTETASKAYLSALLCTLSFLAPPPCCQPCVHPRPRCRPPSQGPQGSRQEMAPKPQP